MHPKIQQQKLLMEQALEKLKDMQATKMLFEDFDYKYCCKRVTELQKEYADVMAELTENLITIAA